MNIEQFNALQQTHSTNVVWFDNESYCFSIGDDVFECQIEELERLEVECDKVESISWYLGYGDDYVNCVTFKQFSDLDKVVGLEEFILKYVGPNCYTYDEDDEDDKE